MWEGVSGWGTHVHPWLIHVNVWQKPPQYCKVISLQLKKKKKKHNTTANISTLYYGHLRKKQKTEKVEETFLNSRGMKECVCACVFVNPSNERNQQTDINQFSCSDSQILKPFNIFLLIYFMKTKAMICCKLMTVLTCRK